MPRRGLRLQAVSRQLFEGAGAGGAPDVVDDEAVDSGALDAPESVAAEALSPLPEAAAGLADE